MEHIYFVGSSRPMVAREEELNVSPIIEKIKNGSIPAYFELLDKATPVTFYKIMNQEVEKEGKKFKLKECFSIDKQKILIYSVLLKENDTFSYHMLYEYASSITDVLSYYKRNQVLFSFVNDAIVNQDAAFLSQVSGFLSQFPCYEWYTKEAGFSKSLKKTEKS